jgi:hypothetical protein
MVTVIILYVKKAKAVPLHATKALGERVVLIAPTYTRLGRVLDPE